MSKVKVASSLLNRSANHLFRNKGYIGGQWVTSANQQVYTIYNPANGEVIGEVPDMAAEDVSTVVDVAYQSFREWRQISYKVSMMPVNVNLITMLSFVPKSFIDQYRCSPQISDGIVSFF